MGRWIYRRKAPGHGATGKVGGITGNASGSGAQTKLDGGVRTPSGSDAPQRNVFISFHTEDEDQVNLLRSQAKNENQNLVFRDYSIKEPFDEQWKSRCRERIAQTSASIVMIGPETANREAVNWEIEESYRQGKKVIGVRIYRDRNDPVPRAIRKHESSVINWNLAEIQRLLDQP